MNLPEFTWIYPEFTLPKKEVIMLFWPILADFWCPAVTLVTGYQSVPNLGTDVHVCPSVPILGTDGQISKNHFFSTDFFAKKNAFLLVFQY